MIRDRKIRFGIVGCGRISNKHFSALRALSGRAEVISACDTNTQALEAVRQEHGVPIYENLERMLTSEKLDVVTLCSPSGLHAEQALLAAHNRISVVCEKPMATRLDDGLSMIKEFDKNRVRLFVVKQNRLLPGVQLLKRAIEERRFGDIKLVHLNVFWSRPQEYYEHGAGWRGSWEFDGGAFMNQASHFVDLLDWLIGPVQDVQAMMSTTRKIEAEDTGVLNIRWRHGAIGSMAVTMLTYPKNLESSITILGDRGTAKLGGAAINEVQAWDFSDIRDYDEFVHRSQVIQNDDSANGHEQYYRNVIDVMRGDAKPDTDGRSGLKSLEIITAAYMAARDRTTVGLPLRF